MRPLNNDDWLYESNCFVCEAKNSAGLQIPFHADDDNQRVVAEFDLDDRFSGAPSLLHGGVTLAVLDEVQAWATIALAHRFALTASTQCTFVEPVFVGHRYRAIGRIDQVTDTEITTTGEIRAVADDRLCTKSTSTFTILSEAKMREVLADDAEASAPVEHQDYLR